MTVQQVFDLLNRYAPTETAFDWDNVGLLLGNPAEEVKKTLVALDCTDEVIREAKIRGCDLIVTHHPVIFHAPHTLVRGTFDGDRLTALIRNDISVISMHTNLDRAEGGVNDTLADVLGLRNIRPVPSCDNILRMGELPAPMAVDVFLNHVKSALNVDSVRCTRVEGRLERVAVGGGACAEYFRPCIEAGCQAFVTADVKHHEYIEAAHRGLLLVDATHFATEAVVLKVLAERLKRDLTEVYIAQDGNPVRVV